MTAEETHDREDALAYLPRKGIIQYQQHQIIYDEHHPSSGLSLIIEGRVKVTTAMGNRAETVVGILGADQFFGERALLGNNPHRERAAAMEKTALMSWSAAEVETLIERQPRLGLALMQILVERCLEFGERLQVFAYERATDRLAWGLIRFTRSGTPQPDGAVSIPPLTHQVLSEYIGTSREVVSASMSEFRHRGFVRYSRKAIVIYPEALAEHLRNQRS